MQDDSEMRRRLAVVQRNRTRSSRVRGMDALTDRLADRVRTGDADGPARIAAAMADVVDDEFRTHCRVASVSASRLVIHVDAHDLVYSMRVHWLYRLRGALAGTRGGRFARIEFRYGLDGAVCCRPSGDDARGGPNQ